VLLATKQAAPCPGGARRSGEPRESSPGGEQKEKLLEGSRDAGIGRAAVVGAAVGYVVAQRYADRIAAEERIAGLS
jgi:hypothetical protein